MMKKWIAWLLVCCMWLPVCTAEREIDWSKPIVALTFDDGPSEYTPKVLELLEQYGCTATFFMLGNRMAHYPDAVRLVAESENEIASHSWNHANLVTLSYQDMLENVLMSKNKIKTMTGRDAQFLRAPYGMNNKDLFTVCGKLDLVLVHWSNDSMDWDVKTPEEVYERVLNQLQNGDIILCHDTYEHTVIALETLLPELINRGYQVVSVAELLSNCGGISNRLRYFKLDLSKVPQQ